MSLFTAIIILFFYFLLKWLFRIAAILLVGKIISQVKNKGLEAIKNKVEGKTDA